MTERPDHHGRPAGGTITAGPGQPPAGDEPEPAGAHELDFDPAARRRRPALIVGAVTLAVLLAAGSLFAVVKGHIGDNEDDAGGTALSTTSAAPGPPRRVRMPYATFTVPGTAQVNVQGNDLYTDAEFIDLIPTQLLGYYFRYGKRTTPVKPEAMESQARFLSVMPNLGRQINTKVTEDLQCKGTVTWLATPGTQTIGTSHAARASFVCPGPDHRPLAGHLAIIQDKYGYRHAFRFIGTRSAYRANQVTVNHIVESFRSR